MDKPLRVQGFGLDEALDKGGVLANVSAFIIACDSEGYTEDTLLGYCKRLGQFSKFCDASAGRDKLTATTIRLFLASKRSTCADQTIFNFHREIRAFCNWLVAERIIKESPMGNIAPPKVEKKIIVPFTREQIQAQLAVCDDSFLGVRNAAIIRFWVDTGVRLGETEKMQVGDVDFQHGLIKILGKGHKERIAHVGKNTHKALIRYRLARGSAPGALWLSEEGQPLGKQGFQRMVTSVCKAAGITGVRCSPHTYRHTFGTMSLEYGAQERQVQELLGHATNAMTKRYTATLQSRWAAEAHKQFSPGDRL